MDAVAREGASADAGAVDDRAALGVDLLPTIADHLRTKLPWKVDGPQSVASVLRAFASSGTGDPDLRLFGKLSGSNAPVRHLAIAVNGKIATTTLTTSNALVPGLSIFSAVLPPEMVQGPNDPIDLYVVEGDESAPRLVPVTVGAQP